MSRLEHVNVTVAEPRATAAMLSNLFGWKTRWEGEALNGGYTVHVGGADDVGVVVDDLDAIEAKVKALGYETHSHADYEPGRRFYFIEENGVEFEVINYD